MKAKILWTLLSLIFCPIHCSLINQQITDEQFYGQKPPGKIPEPYKPGFAFLEGVQPDYIVFSPDRREICFTVEDTNAQERYNRYDIYYTKMVDGKWLNPNKAYFVANGKGILPQFSPDGKRFSYSYKGDIWTSIKKSGRWTPAEKLPEPVNSQKYECGFSMVRGSRFYFAANGRPEGKSNQCDIYYTDMDHAAFGPAVNLDSLNTERSECVLAVAPDEKMIVFTRYFNKSGRDAVDLFISYHIKDGTWTVARRLGQPFNSPGSNHSPRFSPDGRYFFYSQSMFNDSNMAETRHYWVNAHIFDDIRKSELIKFE